ncbi:MAG: glycerol-3-phosphate dehydrogenase (NAD(P)+) [Arcticibacterium sp.]|jgi:glycerol-3-phosphate dehydrogenase (NAD(P)+)
MSLKIAVLGGGSWGTTMGSVVARNCPTTLWARDLASVNEINTSHTNSKYLKGLPLNKNLKANNDLSETVSHADVIIMAIPCQNYRSVLMEVKACIRPWVPVISLSKGLEKGSCLRMTEIIKEILPEHPVGVLTGPNLAKEILKGQAAAAVLAMVDNNIATALQKIFRSGLFRVYTNDDVIGCELAGALKNVIAIAAGMGDGAGAGDNTRATVITRGLAELTRLGVALGGKAPTFAGLAGMGDLLATCISPLSRNRQVGLQLGAGKPLDQIIEEMSMVAEGVKTSGVVIELAKKYNIDMPIATQVYKVIQNECTVNDAFRGLIKREIGAESDPG